MIANDTYFFIFNHTLEGYHPDDDVCIYPKSLWHDKIIYDSDIYERQITLRGNGNE